jgi:hypothetical protein
MDKLYLLDKTLTILAEADTYEAIYDIMVDEKFVDLDTLVSNNPPNASILKWKGFKLDTGSNSKT